MIITVIMMVIESSNNNNNNDDDEEEEEEDCYHYCYDNKYCANFSLFFFLHHPSDLAIRRPPREPSGRSYFSSQVKPVTTKLVLQWVSCHTPGFIRSALELVGPVPLLGETASTICNTRLSRSASGIHVHVAGTLSDQETKQKDLNLTVKQFVYGFQKHTKQTFLVLFLSLLSHFFLPIPPLPSTPTTPPNPK